MSLKEKLKTIKDGIFESFKSGERDFQFLLYIIIIVLLNIASVTLNVRFDLTRSGTYSLSDKSKEVVSDLKENLSIRVLFSKDLPAEHKSMYRYLMDLLEEYDYHGNTYFSYTLVDEDELEKTASDYGIRPVQSREFVDDQVKLRKTYMGLVIQQADIIEKIPTLTSPSGLEFQITSLIMKMSGKIDGLLGLKEPIQLNLYIDSNLKELPIEGINNVEKQVREAVEKSNINNYDKIEFQVVDTSGEDQKADLHSLYGLSKLKWGGGTASSGKKMKAGEGYLGIVLRSGKKFSVIELNVMPTLFGNYVISGLNDLEDSINDAISSIVSSNPKVGYITGHGEAGIKDERSREGAGVMNKLFSDVYDLKEIDLTKEDIPADMETVLVNGPRNEFTDYELFKLDQYLMKGKSAVFFIDSFRAVNMGQPQNFFNQQQPMVLPLNTGLEKLLKHYGITVNKDIVLDKNCAKVNMGNMIRDYPLVPIIMEEGLSDETVITRDLMGTVFMKASSVETDDQRVNEWGLMKRDLVSSSDESWLMTGRINFNPVMMSASGDKDMKSYPLAVLVSGPFESYFKDRDVPADDSKEGKKAGPSALRAEKLNKTIETGKTQVIVVGTSEITRSGFLMDSRRILSSGGAIQGGEVFSNALFLHNMVDYLTGNYYIPEMKSKSLDYNPLDKLGEKEKFVYKAVNIGGVPFLVILAGLIVWRLRWNRRQKIQQEFSQGV